MIEVDEILYRFLKGMSKRRIVSSLGLSRNTVKSILFQAKACGLEKASCESDLARIKESLFALRQNDKRSLRPARGYIAEHHEQIASWLLMPHMTVTQMVRLFKEADKDISESSLRRYIREHFPSLSHSTVHLETKPGQQAQVDFASVGLMKDPLSQKVRKAYEFIMTLSYSRYRFVRFVFKQDVQTWIDCHIRAFHFFGGVPETIMPDNLKSGIEGADLYDPVINRTYGELKSIMGLSVIPPR
jgi:transposase